VLQVPVNVTGLPELQVITCEAGLTVFVGAKVLMPTATVFVVEQPVAGSVIVTVSVLAWVSATVFVFAVNEMLVQL